MKKLFILIAVVVMMMSTATAECNHPNMINDWCPDCGWYRVIAFHAGAITFFTQHENVPVYSEPTSNSWQADTIPYSDATVYIDGITRNSADHIWLRVAGSNQFIRLDDNLYLDFNTLFVENITAINSSPAPISTFVDIVREGGRADYKRSLDPGARSIQYKVKFNGIGFRTITAEELGNIQFGYLGTSIGIPSTALQYGGGVVNVGGYLNPDKIAVRFQNASERCAGVGDVVVTLFCAVGEMVTSDIQSVLSECSNYYCDTREDTESVERGIRLREMGIW